MTTPHGRLLWLVAALLTGGCWGLFALSMRLAVVEADLRLINAQVDVIEMAAAESLGTSIRVRMDYPTPTPPPSRRSWWQRMVGLK